MIGEEVANNPPIGRRLMELRKKRRLTMRDLAAASGASTSLISQVENGKTNPTVAKLQDLATALGVPVNYFFDPHDEPPPAAPADAAPPPPAAAETRAYNSRPPVHTGIPLDVMRSYDRPRIDLSDGVRWERLTPHGRGGIEFLEVTYEVGANSGPLTSHFGEEFVLVLEGALEVEFAFDSVVLRPGDSLAFDSTVPHRVTSVGDVAVRSVWVNWTRAGLRGPDTTHP